MTAARVRRNKVVTFTYEIRDSEGVVHERVDLPIRYVHGGESQLIPEVEQSLEGHAAGDVVQVTLTPEQAFGQPDPALVVVEDLDDVPPTYRRVGAEAMFQNEQGDTKTFVVTKVEGGQVTLDGNHPLAGKTVTFHLSIVDVRDATAAEVKSGRPEDTGTLH
jgi:FKBP-type peptidyl-prolyl cis-trans isomerase SlyD